MVRKSFAMIGEVGAGAPGVEIGNCRTPATVSTADIRR